MLCEQRESQDSYVNCFMDFVAALIILATETQNSKNSVVCICLFGQRAMGSIEMFADIFHVLLDPRRFYLFAVGDIHCFLRDSKILS